MTPPITPPTIFPARFSTIELPAPPVSFSPARIYTHDVNCDHSINSMMDHDHEAFLDMIELAIYTDRTYSNYSHYVIATTYVLLVLPEVLQFCLRQHSDSELKWCCFPRNRCQIPCFYLVTTRQYRLFLC